MEYYIGQILLFAGTFAPKGFALCNGQLMSIAQNQALFSILGTTYGGDGVRTFALPDLRGRVPTSFGQAPGLSPVSEGEVYGNQQVTVTSANLPAGGGQLMASSAAATTNNPAGNVLSAPAFHLYASAANGASAPSVTMNGGSQPISVQPPSLGLNYIIALNGIYPSRS